MEADEKDDISGPNEKIMDCITSCIHVACATDILREQNNLVHVFLVSLAPGIRWTVKMSVFSSIKELCSKLHNESEEISSLTALVCELFHSVSPKVVECISTIEIAQVHVAASDCLLEMIKLYESRARVEGEEEVGFRDELVHQWEIERNGEAKSLLKKCIDILQKPTSCS
ncbi:hypothetical protein LguiA_024443 [Lonicera macranthoides]